MWSIKFSKNAEKSIKKMDQTIYNKIIKYLDREDLLKNPRLFGKPLTANKKGYWRYRVENYRIVCKIEDLRLVILVVDVDHRSTVYD